MTDFRKALQLLSRCETMKSRKCEALKGKTPEQIRSLAVHYYTRARHAEDRSTLAVEALQAAVSEIDRLIALASEAIEGGDA